MWRCMAWLLLLAFASGSLQRLIAEELTSRPNADALQAWAKDLDNDKYAVRDAASRRLSGAGEAAIEPLAKAAESGGREASARAFDLLTQFFQSPLSGTQSKARAALEQLAKVDDAAVARRASQVLSPEPPPAVDPQGFGQRNMRLGQRGFFPGRQGIQLVPGNQIRIAAGGNLQVRMVQNNNRKVIDANENGKQVHIEDDERGIDVTVTEKVNGQEKVTAYGRKKDLNELKNTEPEAAKLYDRYAGGGRNLPRVIGGNIQIQIQANGGAPNPVPLPQNAPPAPAR